MVVKLIAIAVNKWLKIQKTLQAFLKALKFFMIMNMTKLEIYYSATHHGSGTRIWLQARHEIFLLSFKPRK